MKYVVILADGMADRPIVELGGQTPMEKAHTPNMDRLAASGTIGLVRTVPEGMSPGSDTANLAVMGFSPLEHYSGRSPLEAVSMGIKLGENDVTFRCNLITLANTQGLYEDAVMEDYSAGEIETQQAAKLIDALRKVLPQKGMELYPGIYYRHCLVVRDGKTGSQLTPPHDISGKTVAEYLPKGTYGQQLLELQKKAHDVLKDHPINKKRMEQGLNPANACWFWGEGTKPKLPAFQKKYGISGGVISAVDLIKGIGICAGLESVDVPGATGNLHTNYKGKADAALEGLLQKGWDYVYIHLEGPDECGHRGELEGKISAISQIDEKILGGILEGLEAVGEDYRILVCPDHPTPMELRTHTSDPVPFLLYTKGQEPGNHSAAAFSERLAANSGLLIEEGWTLADRLMGKAKIH